MSITKYPAVTLYATDAYGGTDADVGSVEVFTTALDLAENGYDGVMLYFFATFVATSTDDLEWNVYTREDDAGFNGNETPHISGSLKAVAGGEKISKVVFVEGVNAVRSGLISSGTTDVIDAKIIAVPYSY